jgi:hypothetical protein
VNEREKIQKAYTKSKEQSEKKEVEDIEKEY